MRGGQGQKNLRCALSGIVRRKNLEFFDSSATLDCMSGRLAKEIGGTLARSEAPELGPGPRSGVQTMAALDRMLEGSFQHTQVPTSQQRMIRALLLLWNDHLDAAHGIVQEMDGPDAAFIHGIMHRREPDYDNAKYWFQRVGSHPVFLEIARKVESIQGAQAQRGLLKRLASNGKWKPNNFIDACEQAATDPGASAETQLLRQVQRIEIQALMDWLVSSGNP